MPARLLIPPTRWIHLELSTAEHRRVWARLEPLVAAGDLVPSIPQLTAPAEAAIWALARDVAQALPERVLDALDQLRQGRCDVLQLDGEPERDDLPPTIDGVERDFHGGLGSDWMAFVLAHRLGVVRALDVRAGQLRIEWQLGRDGLHRDSLPRREQLERRPGHTWVPRLPPASFTSLRCIRVGSNPEVQTVVAHRREFVEGQLSGHLEWLARPIYRCRILQQLNPLPAAAPGFPIVEPHPDGGWDVSAPCLESSLFTHQGLGSDAIECAPGAARAAVDAFVAARVGLERYPRAVWWIPGRRVIMRQHETYHGRRGGIRPTTDASWATERWMARFNAYVDGRPRPARPVALTGLERRTLTAGLRGLLAEAKAHWRSTHDESLAIAKVLSIDTHAGWPAEHAQRLRERAASP
ncbi:MAG: hypothetical protein KDK70_19985 [Myxococcales bacterium]|nr:hypothetical protein [Myxococcales bacterium]